MGALDDARSHLIKAEEFLAAASANLTAERFNAATSDAVVSGINSKDAICLKLTGRTAKTDNHHSAVAELKGSGREGADLAPTLDRLLKLKTRSQYQTISVARSDAENATRWAEKLEVEARRIIGA
jgi:tRNA A37 threonylcarbamoyladenosine synthetase subunit TsaC/SUA5/YrdC